jgi:membrane protein
VKKIKTAWSITKETFSEWSNDKAPRLSAALAYYTIFSLAPILVIVIAMIGLVFGKEAAQGQIQYQIQNFVGPQSAQTIQTMIAHSQNQKAGIISAALGLAALLFGATGVFSELHDSLNTVWEVKTKSEGGFWKTVKERFLSFTVVLGIGFLLLVSLVISAGLSAFGNVLAGLFPGFQIVAQAANLVISFAVITLLFAMIFKILPDVEIIWRDVWIGAGLTSLLFVIGKYLIGIYLGKSGVSSSYGAAGALVIILLWVYYSAMILFFGAEFTQVYARRFGSRIVPSEEAVPTAESKLQTQASPSQKREEGRKTRPQLEPLPWRRGERSPLAGSLGSLIFGVILGLIYSVRKRKI